MKLKYIDIGVNLMGKQFQSDRDEVVKDSLSQGVGMIITGTDLKSDRAAVEYLKKRQFSNVWCTCGIHPHNADSWNTDSKNTFLKLVEENRKFVIALGEMGLDYDRMFSTKENQKNCFSELLEIAETMKLPLFLHERAAQQDFIHIMKNHRNLCRKSVVHCFTGTKDMAYSYLQLGCLIGITGWICDSRRNKEVVEAVKYIPIERLMIETDAPYLTPYGKEKGLEKRNVPVNISYVAEMIAKIKGMETETVEQAVLENTRKFFGVEETSGKTAQF